jgi:hypothetical protein
MHGLRNTRRVTTVHFDDPCLPQAVEGGVVDAADSGGLNSQLKPYHLSTDDAAIHRRAVATKLGILYTIPQEAREDSASFCGR